MLKNKYLFGVSLAVLGLYFSALNALPEEDEADSSPSHSRHSSPEAPEEILKKLEDIKAKRNPQQFQAICNTLISNKNHSLSLRYQISKQLDPIVRLDFYRGWKAEWEEADILDDETQEILEKIRLALFLESVKGKIAHFQELDEGDLKRLQGNFPEGMDDDLKAMASQIRGELDIWEAAGQFEAWPEGEAKERFFEDISQNAAYSPLLRARCAGTVAQARQLMENQKLSMMDLLRLAHNPRGGFLVAREKLLGNPKKGREFDEWALGLPLTHMWKDGLLREILHSTFLDSSLRQRAFESLAEQRVEDLQIVMADASFSQELRNHCFQAFRPEEDERPPERPSLDAVEEQYDLLKSKASLSEGRFLSLIAIMHNQEASPDILAHVCDLFEEEQQRRQSFINDSHALVQSSHSTTDAFQKFFEGLPDHLSLDLIMDMLQGLNVDQQNLLLRQFQKYVEAFSGKNLPSWARLFLSDLQSQKSRLSSIRKIENEQERKEKFLAYARGENPWTKRLKAIENLPQGYPSKKELLEDIIRNWELAPEFRFGAFTLWKEEPFTTNADALALVLIEDLRVPIHFRLDLAQQISTPQVRIKLLTGLADQACADTPHCLKILQSLAAEDAKRAHQMFKDLLEFPGTEDKNSVVDAWLSSLPDRVEDIALSAKNQKTVSLFIWNRLEEKLRAQVMDTTQKPLQRLKAFILLDEKIEGALDQILQDVESASGQMADLLEGIIDFPDSNAKERVLQVLSERL